MNKPILTSLAALALLAGGAAFAQSAPQPGAMQNRVQWQARHQERLAQLKAQLKLTAAQEPAWSKFTGALESMRSARVGKKMKTARAGQLVPAPQFFEERAKNAEEHARKARELAQVVKTFYDQLTPVQRAVFDTHLADSRHSFMKHRYHMKRMDRRGPPGAPPPPPEAGSGNGGAR